LKENVIIGRLIPAGTGFNAHEEAVSLPGEWSEEEEDLALAFGEEEPTLMVDNLQDDDHIVLDDRLARAYANSDARSEDSEEDFLDEEDDFLDEDEEEEEEFFEDDE
jgi:DNA-directed RNA polymerase subunit beta'